MMHEVAFRMHRVINGTYGTGEGGKSVKLWTFGGSGV